MKNRSSAKQSFSKTYIVNSKEKVSINLVGKEKRSKPQCKVVIVESIYDRGTTRRNNIKTVKTKKINNNISVITNKKYRKVVPILSIASLIEIIIAAKLGIAPIKIICELHNHYSTIELTENDGTLLLSLFDLTGTKRGTDEILLKNKSAEYGLNEKEFNDSLSKLLELKCIRRNDGLIEFLEEITIKKG